MLDVEGENDLAAAGQRGSRGSGLPRAPTVKCMPAAQRQRDPQGMGCGNEVSSPYQDLGVPGRPSYLRHAWIRLEQRTLPGFSRYSANRVPLGTEYDAVPSGTGRDGMTCTSPWLVAGCPIVGRRCRDSSA